MMEIHVSPSEDQPIQRYIQRFAQTRRVRYREAGAALPPTDGALVDPKFGGQAHLLLHSAGCQGAPQPLSARGIVDFHVADPRRRLSSGRSGGRADVAPAAAANKLGNNAGGRNQNVVFPRRCSSRRPASPTYPSAAHVDASPERDRTRPAIRDNIEDAVSPCRVFHARSSAQVPAPATDNFHGATAARTAWQPDMVNMTRSTHRFEKRLARAAEQLRLSAAARLLGRRVRVWPMPRPGGR